MKLLSIMKLFLFRIDVWRDTGGDLWRATVAVGLKL